MNSNTGSPDTVARAAPVGPFRWVPHHPPGVDARRDSLHAALNDLRRPLILVESPESNAPLPAVATGPGDLQFDSGTPAHSVSHAVRAILPAVHPAQLGDPAIARALGIRYACFSGAMANGIASVEVVEAMARAGMLGFFGAAGLSLQRVEDALDRLQATRLPFGVNLIHSPGEPRHEAESVELLLRRQVRLIEASAYLDLTPPVVRYRLAGVRRDPVSGQVVVPNTIVAKVSRVEVATKFLSPAPERLLKELLAAGQLTAQEVELARQVPMADLLTAEADSGGHTDNRPLVTLLPTMLALRDRLQLQYPGGARLRVGAAGGIATPEAAAAAFAMGADYVVTGSVNQACRESGSSDVVREMLAQAEQADVTMAPAADMFEMGVKLQVLKRGTMFPMRAQKLYELYRAYPSLEAVPAAERAGLEAQVFRLPLEEVWRQTRDFFLKRDPTQVARAEAEPRHRMALVFRWYLGQSSRWANAGVPERRLDYQVWCGPAMGAFNEWTRGSFLADFRQRDVATVALNLLVGATRVLRERALRLQGMELPHDLFDRRPQPRGVLEERLDERFAAGGE